MANYTTLQTAIDAGISNMTVLRNGSRQDDGTDTVTLTGVDWFKYNGADVTTAYACGNSWIGFGSSTEHLKINRRDTAMWYLYYESGTITGTKFFKIRWNGYSYWSGTSSSQALNYDVFVFENKNIFINYYTVPTSYFQNTNSLTCGSNTVSFNTSSGVACEWNFNSISDNWDSWTVASGRPTLGDYSPHDENNDFYLTGNVVYKVPLTGVIQYLSSSITWSTDILDESTASVVVQSSMDGSTWTNCTNGGEISGLVAGTDYTDCAVLVKVTLATSDHLCTPVFKDMNVTIRTKEDNNCAVFVFNSANVSCFRNAVGTVTLDYDTGPLATSDMTIDPFEVDFEPSDLVPKNNFGYMKHFEVTPNVTKDFQLITYRNGYEKEHFEVTPSVVSNLAAIQYRDVYEKEHFEVTPTIVANLTAINYIDTYEKEHFEITPTVTGSLQFITYRDAYKNEHFDIDVSVVGRLSST